MSVISIKREISEKRTQIMGIASLGIILVHSIDIVTWSPNLEKLFGFGGTGVYVFVFLSAIGLFHSLKSRGGKNKSVIALGFLMSFMYGTLSALVSKRIVGK